MQKMWEGKGVIMYEVRATAINGRIQKAWFNTKEEAAACKVDMVGRWPWGRRIKIIKLTERKEHQ